MARRVLRFSTARLVEARDRAQLSQSEAARAAGVSRATIHNIETGRHAPAVDTLAALVALYGCSIDWLFIDGEAPPGEDRPAPVPVAG